MNEEMRRLKNRVGRAIKIFNIEMQRAKLPVFNFELYAFPTSESKIAEHNFDADFRMKLINLGPITQKEIEDIKNTDICSKIEEWKNAGLH